MELEMTKGRRNFIAKPLRELMAARRIEEKPLARRAGMPASRVHALLTAPLYRARLDTLLRIADALELDVLETVRIARFAGYTKDRVVEEFIKRREEQEQIPGGKK